MSIYSRLKPNLQPIFHDRPYVRCVHISLVIKMSFLEEKYPGGLPRFAERHTIRCNQDLVAVATMGDDDMGPIIDELYDAGLQPEKDFNDFDATSMAMWCGRFRKAGLGVDWLEGRVMDDMALAVRMKRGRG